MDSSQKKNGNSKRVYFALFALFIVISALSLTGCQSTDESQSYVNTDEFEYECKYDAEKDETAITWSASVNNETIYKMTQSGFIFSLYDGEEFLRQVTIDYEFSLSPGKSNVNRRGFTTAGEVTDITLDDWTAEYASFWDTYKIWIIVMIALAGVGTIIYVIIMITQDLEFDVFEEIWEFVVDSPWIWAIVALIVAAGGVSAIFSYWVQVLIILGGILAWLILAVLAQTIKTIVVAIIDAVEMSTIGLPRHIKKIIRCLATKNYEALYGFPLEQLRDYCNIHQYKGYSKLGKSKLISFVIEKFEEEFDNNKDYLEEYTSELNKGIGAIGEEQTAQPVKKKSPSQKPRKGKGVTFADIAGLDTAKQALREKVIMPFEHKELFEKFGKKTGGGILLYGLPGTGKTMFAEAASNEVNALFIPIKCSDIKSKWYGESETNVKKIFERARKANRAIIFFDEFEAIGAKRTDNGDNGNNDLVPQILAEMQGVGSVTDSVVVVIAATNKPWAIDSAFMRPGRFDEKIYIPLPDAPARKKLFELKLKNVPTDRLDYNRLAEITDGFNGADITEFCEKLKMQAINISLQEKTEHKIDMNDVAIVAKSARSSVAEEDIKMLEEFNGGDLEFGTSKA